MYKTLLLFLLLLHMIGDYYIQTDSMAIRKKRSYQAVVHHCLLYIIPLAGLTLLWSVQALVLALILWILHFATDTAKYFITRKHEQLSEPLVYLADQCLHILMIVIAVLLLKSYAIPFTFVAGIEEFFALLSLHLLSVLRWLLFIAFIWKPANITIKILLMHYKPQSTAQNDTRENAGAFIGVLERMLIAIMLSVNEYAAIGLVLTAKSVARFKRIAEDQTFAEYYLLGTLLSTLFVIIAYFFLFIIL